MADKPKSTSRSKQRQQSIAQKKSARSPRLILTKSSVMQRVNAFLARRPHRSFRRTRRRDYARSLKLPGYIAFTIQVLSHLCKHWRVFGGLILIYTIMSILLVGIASQADFTELSDLLGESGEGIFDGGWGEVSKAGLLLMNGLSSGFLPTFDETQQVFTALLFLMVWLASVWLIRAHLANNKPRLRDALYNSGAPIVSTVIVGCLLVLQMVPAMVGIILYSTALSTDLFSAGAIAMVVSVGAFLLIVLSLYFLTSGFFALIVITLPGMYPWQAIRTAGDLVTGRRLRILLRLTWAALFIVLAWIVVMLPVILFSNWLQSLVQQLAWIPIVPVLFTLASSVSVVFMSAYIYMLYRKVVDDDAAPA